MEWQAILGGLIGSTTTLILTKILDIFADGNKKKIDMQKAFFERKMIAAEGMMSINYSMASAITGLGNLYSIVKEDRDENINWNFFSELNNKLNKQITELEAFSRTASNTFPLYFDINPEIW